jgi:hypothetical protein
MFCLLISEQDEGADMGPYIGQVDTVPIVTADGQPKLNDDGTPQVVRLTVVASTAGNAPEPVGDPQQ